MDRQIDGELKRVHGSTSGRRESGRGRVFVLRERGRERERKGGRGRVCVFME